MSREQGALYFLDKETINVWRIDKTERFGLGVVKWWSNKVYLYGLLGPKFPVPGDKDAFYPPQAPTPTLCPLQEGYLSHARFSSCCQGDKGGSECPCCIAVSQIPFIQNNQYAKVAYGGNNSKPLQRRVPNVNRKSPPKFQEGWWLGYWWAAGRSWHFLTLSLPGSVRREEEERLMEQRSFPLMELVDCSKGSHGWEQRLIWFPALCLRTYKEDPIFWL